VKRNKQSRRFFIKSSLTAAILGIVILWDKMVSTHKRTKTKEYVDIPFNLKKKITFGDDFIIINRNSKTKVLSARCTHLGCRINQTNGESLLCPCHGSEFDLDGNVIVGPAIVPLEEIDFEIDKELKIIRMLV
jgi:cytochrome b6-f complex iron-sulfur subunit